MESPYGNRPFQVHFTPLLLLRVTQRLIVDGGLSVVVNNWVDSRLTAIPPHYSLFGKIEDTRKNTDRHSVRNRRLSC